MRYCSKDDCGKSSAALEAGYILLLLEKKFLVLKETQAQNKNNLALSFKPEEQALGWKVPSVFILMQLSLCLCSRLLA